MLEARVFVQHENALAAITHDYATQAADARHQRCDVINRLEHFRIDWDHLLRLERSPALTHAAGVDDAKLEPGPTGALPRRRCRRGLGARCRAAVRLVADHRDPLGQGLARAWHTHSQATWAPARAGRQIGRAGGLPTRPDRTAAGHHLARGRGATGWRAWHHRCLVDHLALLRTTRHHVQKRPRTPPSSSARGSTHNGRRGSKGRSTLSLSA